MTKRDKVALKEATRELLEILRVWHLVGDAGAGAALMAVRNLHDHLDPKEDRLAYSVCGASSHLLERRDRLGSKGRKVAHDAIVQLACGLAETLLGSEPDGPTSRLELEAEPRNEPAPALPAATDTPRTDLTLTYDGVEGVQLGELMTRMGYLTHEQVDRVLSMQSLAYPPRPFGAIAIELGYTGTAEVESALRIRARATGGMQPSARDDPWGVRPV